MKQKKGEVGMAIFCPLYSGSSGNSAYVDAGESSLLIDLGVSCKAAVTALNTLGADFSKLKGILITHEHSDHIKGLRVFLKKYPLPLYASAPVLEYLQENVELPASVSLHEADPEGFTVGDMQVKPFATCHDSVGSLGYRILLPDGGELGFATDLGCYTAAVEEGLRGCGTVMLESNYDDGMILASDYPYYLKRRIQSNNGHLSNNDCSAVLPQLAASGTKQFVLGHLSQNNNMGLLAHQASEQALLQSGLSPQDFTLQVAQRSPPSTPIVLYIKSGQEPIRFLPACCMEIACIRAVGFCFPFSYRLQIS